MDYAFILTTVSTEEEGHLIANELVKNKLAACVNIVPKVHSDYEWENAILNETEVLLMIKTTKARENDLLLVEDCAHSIETTFHGRSAGTFGDIGCFSFYVTKNIVTGEGGDLHANILQ